MASTIHGAVQRKAMLPVATVVTLLGSLTACAAAPPAPAPPTVSEPPATVLAAGARPQSSAGPRRGAPEPPPHTGGATPDDEEAPPLLRPGRRLHFRGRSRLDSSRPDDRLRPAVGHVFSTLWLAGTEADGDLLLARELFPYSAGGKTSSVLSAPSERRRESLRLDPLTFHLERLSTTSEARRGNDRWNAPLPLRFTDDGFGLNTAARLAAQMHSVALPRALFAALVEQREITHEYDFFLVVEDPLGDRVVVPARPGSPPPPRAERHVQGRTVMSVESREAFRLDRRYPAPPLPEDPDNPPRAARPDERIQLPSVRVRVSADMVIEPATGGGTGIERQDRLTWTVLDRLDEPWILGWEGLIRTESGDLADPDIHEASVSRDLVRIEETRPSLDGIQTPP